MFDRESSRAPTEPDGLMRDALARWHADGHLGDLLPTEGHPLFVLDEPGERILHASAALSGLRAAIADADGTFLPGLRPGAQLRGTGPVGTPARLVRLRLDPRGLAPPATCRVARSTLGDGTPVLLVAPVGSIPAVRAAARRDPVATPSMPAGVDDRPGAQSDPDPDAEAVTATARSNPPQRFVWASDAEGTIARVTGDASIATALLGRAWTTVTADGTVEAPGLADALAERRTFRALAATLRSPEGADEIALDLFGAPAARADRPYAGFAGFGAVRERRPRAPAQAQAPATVPSAEPASAIPDPVDVVPAPPAPGSRIEDAVAPADTGDAPGAEARNAPPRPAEEADASATGLSVNENAAFREIARALGARFAGDDGADPYGAAVGTLAAETSRGAVMAFPARASPRGAALTGVLDQLPVALLVRRDGATLFANHRLLALAGYADTAAFEAGGGLERLTGPRGPAAIVDRAALDWEGGPAEAVIVGAAAEREAVARDLHDAHRGAHLRAAAVTLDALADGVVTLDEAGRVMRLNAPAATLLGAAPREVVGAAFADLFTREAEAAVRAALGAAEEGRVGLAAEAGLRGPGAPSVRLRIARVEGESPALYCATLSDPADDRRRADEAAAVRREAEDAGIRKAGFLAKVSHEIRTPLNGILGFVDAMLAEQYGPLGSERYREYLCDVHASGEHVLGVVTDLLDLARIEAGRADLTFTDLALNDLIANCITLIQPQAARDRIVLRTSLAPDLRPLNADERSMRQAALNVIANAIRFTEAGGQVIVSTALAERGDIVLRVRDTGVGMTPEEVENALEPFRQVAVAGPNRGGGTGLGLTLTKALVEANRGRFRISSRKREGTLVEMVFPGADRLRSA